MTRIRKATVEDLQTVQGLNRKLGTKEHADFDPTVNPEFATTERGKRYFTNSIENNDRLVLIAEYDDMPIGYIAGGIEKVSEYRTIRSMAEVDNMWVDEECRGRGIGRQLLSEFEVWARGKGTNRMRVIASYKNEKAIKFYTREGFDEYDLILEKDLK
jgi:GNAT superfamily N-acetyltransferase